MDEVKVAVLVYWYNGPKKFPLVLNRLSVNVTVVKGIVSRDE
jgi:hypothetical protein